MPQRIVYVQLLDEGVSVWRPVNAEEIGADRFRLIETPGYDSAIEAWEFAPGALVRCEMRQLSGETVAVAVERLQPS
jgi:hypothetical protein